MFRVLFTLAAGVFKRFQALSRLWEASIKVDQFILQLEGIRDISYWEVLLNFFRPLQGLLLDAQQIRSSRNVVSDKVML
jgi:hypothetical protein